MERDYEVISLREWFTLFFIPILPTANGEGRDYFVECRTCNCTYDIEVLERITDTQQIRLLRRTPPHLVLFNNQRSVPRSGGAIQGPNNAKTLIWEKCAPKSPVFGLKPRFLAIKPLNLYSEKWLVLAVF